MTTQPAVLYLDVSGLDIEPGLDLLRSAGIDVLHWGDRPGPEQLARVVALLAGYDPVTDGLLDCLPSLQLVATHSAGIDMVNLAAARARGVQVANVPASAVDEVAVHALALALALIREIPHFDADVRGARWDARAVTPPRTSHELTCGVVGLGRIGRRFAEMAAPLFGKVVGCDPELPEHAWPDGVDRLDWQGFLEVSDCVSLHVPLIEKTADLMDEAAFRRLPNGAVLVNVSRGGLVDEAALLAALSSGHLAGAALDVRRDEPPAPDDLLVAHDRVISTPHVAYLSPSSLRQYAETPVRNVLAMLETGRPLHLVDIGPITELSPSSEARTTP